MKLDIARLPIAEATVAFLVVAIGLTFAGAFAATDNGGASSAVSESPTPRETGSPGASPSPGGPPAVTMADNSFDPDEISVKAGSTTTFEIRNEGRAIHNVHLAGSGGDYTEDFCDGSGDPCSDPARISGGETGILTWQVPPEPGEVDFRCDFHPTDMTGTITIE